MGKERERALEEKRGLFRGDRKNGEGKQRNMKGEKKRRKKKEEGGKKRRRRGGGEKET